MRKKLHYFASGGRGFWRRLLRVEPCKKYVRQKDVAEQKLWLKSFPSDTIYTDNSHVRKRKTSAPSPVRSLIRWFHCLSTLTRARPLCTYAENLRWCRDYPSWILSPDGVSKKNCHAIKKNSKLNSFSWWLYNRKKKKSRLKPMHNIGKVSVNASILYKDQEICNKTNLWKLE